MKESTVIKNFEMTDKGLKITFVSGKVYVYPTVSKETFDEFTKADSKGKFFNDNIRNLKFEVA